MYSKILYLNIGILAVSTLVLLFLHSMLCSTLEYVATVRSVPPDVRSAISRQPGDTASVRTQRPYVRYVTCLVRFASPLPAPTRTLATTSRYYTLPKRGHEYKRATPHGILFRIYVSPKTMRDLGTEKYHGRRSTAAEYM